MYVCEVDRPWLETEFLFQGFRIQNKAEIDNLSNHCAYVFIDTDKSLPASLVDLLGHGSSGRAAGGGKKVRGLASTAELNIVADEQETADFRRDIDKVRPLHAATRSYIDRVLNDVRLGNSIDTGTAKQLVADLADSVVQNPNALMWLTHMKRRDEYTSIHCVNVCILALSFGRCLGLDRKTLAVLGLGALLHDIGKMRVPLEILNKPGRLSDEEFVIMRRHPQFGHALLKQDLSIPPEALAIVLSHHEKLGGGGYPDSLKGEQIHHLTRVVTLVDVYDAITSDRVYHNGMPPHDALKRIYDWMPGNFDPELTEQFIRCIGIYPVGSLVELSTGHIGLVTSLNAKSRLRPVVMLLMNPAHEIYRLRKLINLAHPKWQEGPEKIAIQRIIDPAQFNIDIARLIALELGQS